MFGQNTVCIGRVLIRTFFAQQEGVETQVVDAEIEPALSGYFALPVAAGVIVHQLLFLGHSKEFAELGNGLLEFVCVVILLDVMILVVLRNDALQREGATHICERSPLNTSHLFHMQVLTRGTAQLPRASYVANAFFPVTEKYL